MGAAFKLGIILSNYYAKVKSGLQETVILYNMCKNAARETGGGFR